MTETPYGEAFFEGQRGGSAASAAIIVPWLVSTFQPRRAVDVGCGVGTWAAAMLAAGVPDVIGIDGGHVSRQRLAIPAERFRAADLADASLTSFGETFDLSVCLEVAEHLPPARAESFVALVVSLAPIAVFGAAIPGQGGTDHVNEQWQSYWAALFARHGFVAHDMLRPRFWASPVEYWYAQNTIVYAAPGREVPGANIAPLSALDVAHPKLVQRLNKAESRRRRRREGWIRRLGAPLKLFRPA